MILKQLSSQRSRQISEHDQDLKDTLLSAPRVPLAPSLPVVFRGLKLRAQRAWSSPTGMPD